MGLEDIYRDLSTVKAASTSNTEIKAWITNIDLNGKPEITVKTGTGEQFTEELPVPESWSTEEELPYLLELYGIDIENAHDIDNAEIRYNPIDDELVELEDSSIELMSSNSVDDVVLEYTRLKNSTLEKGFVEAEIVNVRKTENEDITEIDVDIPTRGILTYRFETPRVWNENEYPIVELCNSLDVNTEELLTGKTVIVHTAGNGFKPRRLSNKNFPVSGDEWQSKKDIVDRVKTFDSWFLLPKSYVKEGIPVSQTTEDEDKKTDNNKTGVSPVVGVILMVTITLILASIMGAFILNSLSDLDGQPQVGMTIDEKGDYVKVQVIETQFTDELIFTEGGETIQTTDVGGYSQEILIEPKHNQGEIVIIAETPEGEKHVIKTYRYSLG